MQKFTKKDYKDVIQISAIILIGIVGFYVMFVYLDFFNASECEILDEQVEITDFEIKTVVKFGVRQYYVTQYYMKLNNSNEYQITAKQYDLLSVGDILNATGCTGKFVLYYCNDCDYYQDQYEWIYVGLGN